MKTFHIYTVAAMAFAASMMFVACDDFTSASNGDVPKSSSAGNEDMPESSSVPESSSDETTLSGEDGKAVFDKDPISRDHLLIYGDQLKNFPICGAENEGAVDSLIGGNVKYGYETYYYKCKKGIWYETDASVNCNTDGVKVGDICKVKVGTPGWMSSRDGVWKYYVYEGNGAWKEADARDRCNAREKTVGTICVIAKSTQYFHNVYLIYTADGVWEDFLTLMMSSQGVIWEYGPGFQMPKECTAENEGAKEKFVFGAEPDAITLYFKCSSGEWNHLNDIDYYCTTGNNSDGDTCSFKPDENAVERSDFWVPGEFDFVEPDVFTYYYYSGNWLQSSVDPEFGYCPEDYGPYLYKKHGDEYYTCVYGDWKPAHLVPHQYTDPRKEGLTDEEYDVLDLPSEASVGDRVGGLLENCFDNVELPLGGPSEWRYEMYDYCMSKNYYRYRESGSWTLETDEEFTNDPAMHYNLECAPGTEGAEFRFLPESRDPGRIYRRTSIRYDTVNVNGAVRELIYCDDALVGYNFGRTE